MVDEMVGAIASNPLSKRKVVPVRRKEACKVPLRQPQDQELKWQSGDKIILLAYKVWLYVHFLRRLSADELWLFWGAVQQVGNRNRQSPPYQAVAWWSAKSKMIVCHMFHDLCIFSAYWRIKWVNVAFIWLCCIHMLEAMAHLALLCWSAIHVISTIYLILQFLARHLLFPCEEFSMVLGNDETLLQNRSTFSHT